MRRDLLFLVPAFCAFFAASPAKAYSPSPPKRHDIFSQNREYVLDVDPDSEVNTVFSASDRSKPIWSFRGKRWAGRELLSNDGNVVVLLSWPFVTEEQLADSTAMVFLNKDGPFKTYAIHELVPDPALTREVGPGPIGDFWRTWYSGLNDDGDEFTLHTTGKYYYRFRYPDGEVVLRTRLPQLHRQSVIAGAVVAGLALITVTYFVFVRRRRSHAPQIPLGNDEA